MIRVVAGLAFTVIALVGIGSTIRALRAEDRRPAVDSETVEGLFQAWTGVAGSGPASTPLVEDGVLYVATGTGLTAFPPRCEPEPGSRCEPLWRATVPDGPLSTPVLNTGSVYAGSGSGQVYAFSARCDARACPPEWVGLAGSGRVSEPGVNDDLVYVTSDRLYAFPAACGSQDRSCPPAWSAAVPGRPAPGAPALGGGLVLVASSSVEGGIFAYPAVCTEDCAPVWSGPTDGPATAVAIGGGSAYVVARGRLLAFPLSCTGTCAPQWRGAFLPGGPFATGALSAPAPAGDRVYVGDDRGSLWVFPATCPDAACDPLRSYDLAESPLGPPVARDGLVLAASRDGGLFAVVDSCSGDPGCPSTWRVTVGADIHGGPAVDPEAPEAVYVADDRGVVHAFAPAATG